MLQLPFVEDGNMLPLGAESQWKVLTDYDIAFRYISLPEGAAASDLRLNVDSCPTGHTVRGVLASSVSGVVNYLTGNDWCSTVSLPLKANNVHSGMLVYLRSTRAVVGFVSRKLDDFHDKPTVVVRWEYVYLTVKEHLGIAERVDVIEVCPIEYVYTLVYSFIWLSVVSTAPNQSDHTTKTTNAGKTHDVSPPAQEWFVRM